MCALAQYNRMQGSCQPTPLTGAITTANLGPAQSVQIKTAMLNRYSYRQENIKIDFTRNGRGGVVINSLTSQKTTDFITFAHDVINFLVTPRYRIA